MIVSYALLGALSFFLGVWIVFAVVCFRDAWTRDKKEAEKPLDIQEDTTLIRMSVEHLRWKEKRGYLWGGGWKYENCIDR